jgi:hypothetical protein
MSTEKKRGGTRNGSGRKLKFGETSKVLQVRVPVSKYDNMKKALNILLTADFLERFLYEFENHE